MRDFKGDMIDLFERKRGGHVQHWLYTDAMRERMTGSQLWSAFTQSSRGYYIPEDEMKLIGNHGSSLVAGRTFDTVVDFGVGAEPVIRKKVIPIINGLNNVGLYSGVDISQDLLSDAADVVNAERPDLRVETHHRDFHYDKIELGGQKRLGLLFGCSVSNQNMKEGEGFPQDQILKNLKDFREHLGVNGELLVTHDANADSVAAIAAYDSPYWSEHVTGLMYDVQRELQTGGDFDPAAWSHQMLLDDAVNVIHQCVVATRAQTLEVGDRVYDFRLGERFVAVNNFKFSDSVFKGLCDQVGLEVRNSVAYKSIRLNHLII